LKKGKKKGEGGGMVVLGACDDATAAAGAPFGVGKAEIIAPSLNIALPRSGG
jgi:hypothetical protein